MSTSFPAGGKHALLIGIDQYPNLGDAQQLKGCVNDSLQLRSLLEERFAFPSAGIVLLKNEKATRDAILASFKELAHRVAPGDVVVVGYSGHGSRTRTGDGPTGWDESIVPYNSGRSPHPNRDILDDEIHQWLLTMAAVTPNLTLVFDSCFSGGITRDPFEVSVRWAPPDCRPATGTWGRRDASHQPSGWRSLGSRYTLIAACRSDESAREIHLDQGSGAILHHGALTYFLCRELQRADRETSSRDIFERIAARVTTTFPAQHPLLEGARDREPFGPRLFDTMRFLPVRSRQDHRAVLAGGAAHGLTVGSRWAVYPQGTHQVTPQTPCLGRVRVLSVKAVSAEVEIEQEVGPRFGPGDRAIETDHSYGEARLVADICGPHAAAEPLAALRGRVSKRGLLRLAGTGERGDVRVYLVSPRAAVRDGDPVPRLGAIASPLWVAVGSDGSLLFPALPVSEEGSLSRLIENLEVHARYRLIQRLANPDPASRLRGKIEVNLLRRRSGEWLPAKPADGGMVTFEDGEPFDIQVVNRSGRVVYIHVLDLGLTGRVELLYPVEGAREELQTGQPFRIGEKRGSDLEFFIPESFPFENPGGAVKGSQHLKVLVTVAEVDFRLLLQDGVRYLESEQGTRPYKPPLELLLASAMTGAGTRETRPVANALDDDWTTVTRSLLIQRDR